MARFRIICLLVVIGFAYACSSGDKPNDTGTHPEIPTDVDKPNENKDKPVQMWIDAHANFSRFSTKENIATYIEKMKSTGFTEIYVDVKPGIGLALYDSDILPPLVEWGAERVERNWDYLQYWIDEAERNDIKVIASISTLGFGYTKARQGLVYQDSRWDGKTQFELPDPSHPNEIVDIRDQEQNGAGDPVDAAILNPCIPEVQAFVISIVAEIVTKYPKLKGICLDYCRWYGDNYGFSDATMAAFESYSGSKVNSRNDILTATGAPGPMYAQWIEFRTMTITNLVTNIRSKIKSIDSEMELHLWASAHWKSRYTVGQNWASKKYVPTGWQYTANYSKTGFADQIDAFSLGAYADAIWKTEAPGSDWSVENFVNTYNDYTMGDCKVYGSFASYAYISKPATRCSDAVYLCLKNTDGVMVFELSHVINGNQWAAIKDGIDRVMK